jgi:hypothetical protein
MNTAAEPTRPDAHPPPPQAVTLRQTWWFWLKVGCISFGGPAGQIALLHQELVERRRWISERRFLHALNYCMVLPGPEAQQLATYLGWLMQRSWGGIVAGALLFAVVAWVLVMIREIRDSIQVSDFSAHGARQDGYDEEGISTVARPAPGISGRGFMGRRGMTPGRGSKSQPRKVRSRWAILSESASR